MGDPQISRIDKAQELGRLVIQGGVTADWIAACPPQLRNPRVDVGRRFVKGPTVAAVTIGAADLQTAGRMHVADVRMAGHAAFTLGKRRGGVLAEPVVMP